MAQKVNKEPLIPKAVLNRSADALADLTSELIRTLYNELRAHATRVNNAYMYDGTERPTAPMMLPEYTVSTLPSASKYKGGLIAVTNETGGYTVAFSDNTNWRRVQDRAIVA